MKIKTKTLIVLSLMVLASIGSSQVQAQSIPYIYPQATSLVQESRDYATEVLGDPWDMSNKEDMSHKVIRFSGASMSGGLWSGTTTSSDSQFWFHWGGYPGSYSTARDGTAKPINASFYKRLSFRMYIGTSSTAYRRGQFYWFTNQNLTGAKVELFRVFPGWHTYQIDLPSSWTGWPISLRMDPIDRANTPVKIDWIRLTNRPGTAVDLSWSDTVSGTGAIYFDEDNSGFDGTSLAEVSSSSGNNSNSVDIDGLDPGTYYFYIKKADGSYSNYSTSVIVNKAPFVKITDPDEVGGRDWATTYLKNPWDMKSPKDIIKTYNVGGSRFSGGVYTGINVSNSLSGARKNDPYIMLNLGGKTINTSKFHRLTYRYKFAGGFSLARGTMSRFGWTLKKYDDPKYWQISDDVVTFNGWHTTTIDLKKIKLNRGRYGWKNYISRFRFDPHEDRLSRRFYVDSIYLREDDHLSSSFVIRYNLADSNNSSSNISIYADRDKSFGNGNESLINSYDAVTGSNAYRWAPSSSVKGTFWIYVKANDGTNVSGYYSSGPLKVH